MGEREKKNPQIFSLKKRRGKKKKTNVEHISRIHFSRAGSGKIGKRAGLFKGGIHGLWNHRGYWCGREDMEVAEPQLPAHYQARDNIPHLQKQKNPA